MELGSHGDWESLDPGVLISDHHSDQLLAVES